MAEPVGKIILCGVRLSFDHIFEPTAEEKDDGSKVMKFKCNFLIPKAKAERDRLKIYAKHKGERLDVLEALKRANNEAMAKKTKSDDPSKWPKLAPDRKQIRDGDLKEYDGYPTNWYVTASADVKDPPKIITNRKRNGEWIPAEPGGDGAPYAGCYVNATVSAWMMDHPKFGKRLCLSLHSVQFNRDGESFRAMVSNVNEDFDDDDVGEIGSIGDDEDADLESVI